jgi:uncharacterized Zn finger protein
VLKGNTAPAAREISKDRTFTPEDAPATDHPTHRPNRPPQKRFNQPANGNTAPQDGQSPRPNRTNRPNRPQQRRPDPQQGTDIPQEGSNNRTYRQSPRRPTPRNDSPTQDGATPRRNTFSRGRPDQRNRFSERPAPTVPIRTNQGIKARSQRGQFSQHWWARRWIEAMESLVDPARLQRGRSYARTGQVLSIDETQNGIASKVQGSRPQPYIVTIQVTPLTDEQWDLVIEALSEQALFTAQLLAGEMPGNIEDAFNSSGVSLFPSHAGDLISNCSCPDWANPCKHVAATHYILGDRFDDDPFLLFRMRGRSQEQILEALRQRRIDTGEPEDEVEEEPVEKSDQSDPLEASIDHFWEPVEPLDSFPLTMRLATVEMPLLQRLGEPAFLGGHSLQTTLKPVYDIITRSALLAAYSDEEPAESSANGNGNGNGNGQE